MNSINKYLYELGLLHESHSKSVHIAGYISYGSILVLLILFILAAIDEFVLGGALREYLSVVGKLSLFGLGVGTVLTVLATNKII